MVHAVGHTSQVRLGSLTCKLTVGPRRNRTANGTGEVQHLNQNSIWFPIDTHRSSRRRRRRQVKEEVIFVPHGQPMECKPKEPVRVNVLFKHVRKMLSGSTAVIAEACDSWFNCRKLKLPEGCGKAPSICGCMHFTRTHTAFFGSFTGERSNLAFAPQIRVPNAVRIHRLVRRGDSGFRAGRPRRTGPATRGPG